MANKKVIVYTVTGCPRCKIAIEYLRSINIDFEEIDVKLQHDKAKEMIVKSGQKTVPVIDIEGTIVVGFDKAAIDDALHK